MSSVAVSGEAREVALAEVQAVSEMAHDELYREQLAAVVAAVGEGEVSGAEAEALEQLLELGLQSGRLRALYGPAGEQAALRLYRRLPRGAALAESAREVTEALSALRGKRVDSIALAAVGPGSFSLSLAAEGLELTIRVDRQGARVASLGV